MSTAAKSVLFLAILLLTGQSPAQPAAATLIVEPQTIQVDVFYSGAEIRVSGVSQAGDDLALVCTGMESRVELNEKEKIWGFLWVNARSVAFENVPSLYHLVSAKDNPGLDAKSDMFFAGIGLPALEARIVPKEDHVRHRCFPELIKLKQHEGLYSVQEGRLEIRPEAQGRQKFSAIFQFPSRVAPGEYRLRLMSFAGGKPVDLAEQVIVVRLAGAAALIRALSSDYGLIYGILSVVIALAAGLLSGIVFGHRSGKVRH